MDLMNFNAKKLSCSCSFLTWETDIWIILLIVVAFLYSLIAQIAEVLTKYTVKLEEISFFLAPDVHKLINDKAMVNVLPGSRQQSEYS